MFDGFLMNAASLPLLSHAKSRSLSAENFRGTPNGGALATEGTRRELRPQVSVAGGRSRRPTPFSPARCSACGH